MDESKFLTFSKMLWATAFILLVVGMGGILYFAEFGFLMWTRSDSWADFGSFISGSGGTAIAMLALLWLIYSVQVQRVELRKLTDQQKIDLTIDDCRNLLEKNLSHIEGEMDQKVHKSVANTVQQQTGKRPSTFLAMLKTAERLKFRQEYSALKEIQDSFLKYHYEDLDRIKTRIILHTRAILDWKNIAMNADMPIPHGVVFYAEKVIQEAELLHYYFMFDDDDAMNLYLNIKHSIYKV